MLIRELALRRLLSFSPESSPLEMRPLGNLIGPNGSNKLNIVATIDLPRFASERSAPIARIELVKGPDHTAPVVMAVTVEGR